MGKYGEEVYICMGNVTFESEELPFKRQLMLKIF